MTLLSSIFGVLVMVSISSARNVDSRSLTQQLADANNHLAVNVYKSLTGRGNVFFSPLSLSSALSMLYLGARENTAAQMKDVLGFRDANFQEDQDVHRAFRDMLNRVQNSSPKEYTLSVANKVLARDDLNVKDEYKQDLSRYYEAEVEEADFFNNGGDVVSRINSWVNEKTHGKISSLFNGPLDPSTVLMLLNAVYFKGTWKTQFDKRNTIRKQFYNYGETEKQVPFMHVKSRFPYADSRSLNSQVLELPYTGENTSMVIILPNDRNGLQNLESALTSEKLQEAIDQLYTSTVVIQFPKFKLQRNYNLNGVLSKLGMEEAFSGRADLTGISDKDIYVSEVVHKAVVEVNEEGSEAAAVTGIGGRIRPSINPPQVYEFIADHPFIFMIRERTTRMILFLGKVDAL